MKVKYFVQDFSVFYDKSVSELNSLPVLQWCEVRVYIR